MVFGLEFWAITFDFVGKFLIAVAALMTHRRIAIEKHIDKIVLKDLKYEVAVGIVAIVVLVIGYILHLFVLAG
jgi:hypothetical protein